MNFTKRGCLLEKIYAAVKKGDKYIVWKSKPCSTWKYQISGGGVDEGEDNVTAIKRELIEELNVNVNIIKSLGVIKYIKTWRYEGKEFDVDYEAEIFLTEFVSYSNNNQFGIEGEFAGKEMEIVEISESEMLENVSEFKKFGLTL